MRLTPFCASLVAALLTSCGKSQQSSSAPPIANIPNAALPEQSPPPKPGATPNPGSAASPIPVPAPTTNAISAKAQGPLPASQTVSTGGFSPAPELAVALSTASASEDSGPSTSVAQANATGSPAPNHGTPIQPPPLLPVVVDVAAAGPCSIYQGGMWTPKPCAAATMAPPPMPPLAGTLSSQPVIEAPNMPITYAQAYFVFDEFGPGETSVFATPSTGATTPSAANTFSIQINTDAFTCNGGHKCWVQFVYDYNVNGTNSLGQAPNGMQIWIWDTTVPSGSPGNIVPTLPVSIPQHVMQEGDALNLAAYIDPTTGSLVFTVQTIWQNGGAPVSTSYTATHSDDYGLGQGNSWQGFSAVLVGIDGGAQGVFSQTKVLTQMVAFSNGPVGGTQLNEWKGTGTTEQLGTDPVLSGATGESSNLLMLTYPELAIDSSVPNIGPNVTNGVYMSYLTASEDLAALQGGPQLPLETMIPPP